MAVTKITGVYLIKNKINGTFYVGQSVSIASRWSGHKTTLRNKTHTNVKLQNAFNKYGEDVFEFSILERCEKEDLLDLEIKYYDELLIHNKSYNLERPKKADIFPKKGSKPGRTPGFNLTDKQKEHLSKINTGKKRNLTDEQRAEVRAQLASIQALGVAAARTPEAIAKMQETRKLNGVNITDDTRELHRKRTLKNNPITVEATNLHTGQSFVFDSQNDLLYLLKEQGYGPCCYYGKGKYNKGLHNIWKFTKLGKTYLLNKE